MVTAENKLFEQLDVELAQSIVTRSRPMKLAELQTSKPYTMCIIGFTFLFALALMCIGQGWTTVGVADFDSCLINSREAVVNWKTQQLAEAGYRRDLIMQSVESGSDKYLRAFR